MGNTPVKRRGLLALPEAMAAWLFARMNLTRLDAGEAVRFAFVGVLIAIIYVAAFYPLRDGLGLVAWQASLAAFFLAVCVQYILQTKVTFRKSLFDAQQLIRFVVTVTLGSVLSTTLLAYVWPKIGWPDGFALLIVIFILPILNFIIFSLWVYRRPPVSADDAHYSGKAQNEQS